MVVRDSWATQASGPTGQLDVEECRLAIGALVYPHGTNFKGKSGFRPGPGTSPGLVTATGTPDGFVHVAPFQLLLQSGRATAPGTYEACIDATFDVNILSTPADPTNPRDDLIVAQQSDTFYADANSLFAIRQVVGTPAGSPSDPAVSGSPDYVTLARVRVDAAATTITNAKITDLRTSGHAKSLVGGLYSVGLGGVLPVASSAQRDALSGVYDGMMVWRSDTEAIEVYDGAAWTVLSTTAVHPLVEAASSYAPVWSSTGTAPAIGNGTITGTYRQTGKRVDVRIVWVAGTTTTFGTGTYSFSLPATPVAADWTLGAMLNDVSASQRFAGQSWIITNAASGDNMRIIFSGESAFSNMTNTSPITLATGDRLILEGWFDAA